jgi:hypothetical protein
LLAHAGTGELLDHHDRPERLHVIQRIPRIPEQPIRVGFAFRVVLRWRVLEGAMPKLEITEAGRSAGQEPGVRHDVREMMLEQLSDPDDLFFKTALLLCTDDNNEIQMLDKSMTRFIKSNLLEIKKAALPEPSVR